MRCSPLFLGIATVLADGGFSMALIQRKDTTHVDESTVFWVNLAAGALLAAGISLLAPVFADFYDVPVLEPLARLMSLGVLLSAMGSVPSALTSKQLDFRRLFLVGAVAAAASGGLAVALAWQGHGIWALAGQYVTMTAVSTAMLWILSGWRPRMLFSAGSARRLFGFGGYMLASNLLDTAFSRFYTLLIGRWYGVRDLGFYQRADTTQQVPAAVLSSIASRVAFPLFSQAIDDKAQLRRGVRLALRGLMLINVPMMLGLAALAGPLLEAVFGAIWLPAAPILQVLCLAGLFWPVHVINLTVLAAQGHARLFLRPGSHQAGARFGIHTHRCTQWSHGGRVGHGRGRTRLSLGQLLLHAATPGVRTRRANRRPRPYAGGVDRDGSRRGPRCSQLGAPTDDRAGDTVRAGGAGLRRPCLGIEVGSAPGRDDVAPTRSAGVASVAATPSGWVAQITPAPLILSGNSRTVSGRGSSGTPFIEQSHPDRRTRRAGRRPTGQRSNSSNRKCWKGNASG